MARTRPTAKEIIDLIKSMGGREVTEEDKKADCYKGTFEWPSCFKSQAPRRSPRKKITGKKQSGFKDKTTKKTVV